MSEHADLPRRPLQGAYALENRGKFLAPKPQPVHPRIDLEPDHEAVISAEALEEPHLKIVVNDDLQPMQRSLEKLLAREDALEKHDRLRNARFAQCDALFQARD